MAGVWTYNVPASGVFPFPPPFCSSEASEMSRARTTIHRFRHTYRCSSPSISSSSSATSRFQFQPHSSLFSFPSHPNHTPIPNPFHFPIHSSYFSSSAPKQDFLGSDGNYPTGDFDFEPVTGWKRFIVKLRMLIVFPWERIQHGSVLKIKLRGQVFASHFTHFSLMLLLCAQLVFFF